VYDVPLAAAIIQASVWPGLTNVGMSEYNLLTKGRWMRAKSPFAGETRAKGREAMRAAVSRMIKARHSSTHFLASGWGVVAKKLRSMMYGGPPPTEKFYKKLHAKETFGAATILSTGSHFAVRIENLIGMVAGKKGQNAANYNRALHRHGGPALQAAVDEQGAEMVARHWPKEQAEFARKFNAMVR